MDNPAAEPGHGTIVPLDNWNTEILDSGQPTVAGAFCSAHYVTVNNEGFVAQAWFQQGACILDVRDPSDTEPLRAPILPQWLAAGATTTVASRPSDGWGYICRLAPRA